MGTLRELGIFLLASSYIWVPFLIYMIVKLIGREREHRDRVRRMIAARKEVSQ